MPTFRRTPSRSPVFLLLAAAGVLGAAGLALGAGAATVRLSDRPEASDYGKTLHVRGALQNLAPGGAAVTFRARGLATIVCVAPGSKDSTARNSRSVAVVTNASLTIPDKAVVGGVAPFEVTVGPPVLASSAAAGCPSDRWTARIDEVDFRSVTIRVTQGGRVVMEQTLRL